MWICLCVCVSVCVCESVCVCVCVCCQRHLLPTDFGMLFASLSPLFLSLLTHTHTHTLSLVGVCPNNKVEKRRQQEQEKEDGADAEAVMERIKLLVSARTMHHAHASFAKHTRTHKQTHMHASFHLTLRLSPDHARRWPSAAFALSSTCATLASCTKAV